MLRPTNNAAQVVAGWLGNAPAAASTEEVPMPEFTPRPERLGLGAKFVPHSAALTVGEQKFTKNLKASIARNTKPSATPKQKQQISDDDSEDEGRSSSVRSNKRKHSAGGGAAPPGKSAAVKGRGPRT